jgi:hypothetical protein
MVRHKCRQQLASTSLRESRCKFPRRFPCVPRVPAAAACHQLRLYQGSPIMPGCGQRLSPVQHPCPLFPLISTTCVGVLLARALPINMRRRNASALLRRVYVTDSGIRSQLGRRVSRAAIPQGIQLRRLHSVRPLASARLTGIQAMNTALSSRAIGPLTTNIDSDRLISSIVYKTCDNHRG